MTEAVNHPAHYGGADNPYEHIKVCDAWGLNYRLGNCTKYISRAGKKGGPEKKLEDLRKALWYLQDEIAQLEQRQKDLGSTVQVQHDMLAQRGYKFVVLSHGSYQGFRFTFTAPEDPAHVDPKNPPRGMYSTNEECVRAAWRHWSGLENPGTPDDGGHHARG